MAFVRVTVHMFIHMYEHMYQYRHTVYNVRTICLYIIGGMCVIVSPTAHTCVYIAYIHIRIYTYYII